MNTFPWTTALDQFLALLLASELMTLEELGREFKEFSRVSRTSAESNDIEAFSHHLVSRGLLTEWQCGKLREKKYKGFFLGCCKLLRWLKTDDQRAYYLAKDLEHKCFVRLAVTPAKDSVSGQVEYEVIPLESPDEECS